MVVRQSSSSYTRWKGVHSVPVRAYGSIRDLSLSVGLWMGNWREFLFDIKLIAPFSEMITGKLLPVIADDYSWNIEATNDVAPHELEHFLASYCCCWFSFYPFGEIFDGDDQEFDPSWCFREWSYYVDPPLVEGPGARDAS
ncbi:hypothetical protein Tco_0935241 [Tanacetum coccineum]